MAEGRTDKSDFDSVPGQIKQRECQPCSRKNEKTAADVFCSTCDEFQCAKCRDIHNIYAYMKTHKLVDASEVKLKQGMLITNELDQCDKHKRTIKFFCEDDREMCCSKCAFVNHRKCHNVQDIETIAENSQSTIPYFKTALLKLKGNAELVVKHMQTSKEHMRQNVKDLPKKITHLQDKMNKMFEDLKCYVSKETEKFQTQTEEKLTKKQFLSETLVTEINNKSLKSIAHNQPIVELEKITSIDLKQTGNEAKEPFYTGLDFLPDGRLVAVDNKNKKYLVFNEKLEKVGSYQLSYSPQSVVVVSEEEVTITSSNEFKMENLRVSKSNKITAIKTLNVKTEYKSICMKDDNNFVVGTVDDTPPVRIVSLTGEEKDLSINFPNRKYPVGSSSCTYVRNSDKLVLTDRYENTVYIYDIATDTRVVVKDDRIKSPRGVAVGPADVLMVCSEDTNSIVEITASGQVLTSYKLDMSYPRTVSVSRDKSILAVANCRTGEMKIQLFNIKYSMK